MSDDNRIHTGDAPVEPFRAITRLSLRDRLRHWGYRWGIGRMQATVAPGLYQVGDPDANSPVLVSANYRMSFDLLRSVLTGRNVWILVIDTKGINVWCAAGKGTFGTGELVRCMQQFQLAQHVSHRQMILPQLGAPGVAAHEIKQQTGFLVKYGPIRARDLPVFLDTGQATPAMRRVTFNLRERLALAPMELLPAFWPVVLIATGIGWAAGWKTGLVFLGLGLSAPIAVPALLPWLPGTWLSLKGTVWGLGAALLAGWALGLGSIPWFLLAVSAASVSAYLAFNFTGATPYTSINGVKREMRHMLPFIISGAGVGLLGWIFMIVRKFWT